MLRHHFRPVKVHKVENRMNGDQTDIEQSLYTLLRFDWKNGAMKKKEKKIGAPFLFFSSVSAAPDSFAVRTRFVRQVPFMRVPAKTSSSTVYTGWLPFFNYLRGNGELLNIRRYPRAWKDPLCRRTSCWNDDAICVELKSQREKAVWTVSFWQCE